MSSRALVLVVFVLWSAISWYWYVCGIKQQCGEPPIAMGQQAIPFEPETLLNQDVNTARAEKPEQSAIQPANTPSSDPLPETVPEPDISKVYVHELADHVLIHFPYNSTRKEESAATDTYLSRLADQLKSSGGTVTLTGHTDIVGDSKTNQAFALRRAKNIRDILLAKGVPRKQIVCKSYGEKKPIATNDNPVGRYQNRRVEIRVAQ
jgi:outer membrane protein OmpA-like peptidoglycan-associated protein